MGQLLLVECHRCGATSEQVDGAVSAGFHLRCVECGQTRFVDLQTVFATDPPGVDGVARAGAELWRRREERLPVLAGPCDCGGRFDGHAALRCLECRSEDVATTVRAMID